MVKIGSNIESLRAQRRLNETSTSLAKTYERLSSGMRINNASDDATGLGIAEQLNSSSRVFAQAIRNVNDGVSYLTIADSALGALSDITIRLKELTTQSANGTFSTTQRQSINKEADALVNEYNRIIESTQFNNNKIFDGTPHTLSIQAGYGADGSISLNVGEKLSRVAPEGSYTYASDFQQYGDGEGGLTFGDFNHDGITDMVGGDRTSQSIGIHYGNGDGTFRAPVSLAAPANDFSLLSAETLTSSGRSDLIVSYNNGQSFAILISNEDGTFTTTSYTPGHNANSVAAGDVNGDGKTDLAVEDYNGTLILLGNGDGTFKAPQSQGPYVYGLQLRDLNSDGKLDLLGQIDSGTIAFAYGNGDGTFGSRITYSPPGGLDNFLAGDFNRDGITDIISAVSAVSGFSVALGKSNGTFSSPVLNSVNDTFSLFAFSSQPLDLNGDGLVDMNGITIDSGGLIHTVAFYSNGDGSFKSQAEIVTNGINADTFVIPAGLDFNKDGVFDAFGIDQNSGNYVIALANTTKTSKIPFLDLGSQLSARAAIPAIDDILQRISAERGVIGAYQSRLQIAANNLQSTKLNYDAAAGRITDLDFAQESAELVRKSILQQAGASVLTQANQEPALALELLSNIKIK